MCVRCDVVRAGRRQIKCLHSRELPKCARPPPLGVRRPRKGHRKFAMGRGGAEPPPEVITMAWYCRRERGPRGGSEEPN